MERARSLRRSIVRLQGLITAVNDDWFRQQMMSELSELKSTLEALLGSYRGLEEQNRSLLYLSRRDEVTNLFNQRYFMERLDEEFRRALRYGSPLSLLIADLDDFKAFNDTRGHLVGNDLLRQVASVIRQGVRDIDLPARYGGDEFVVLLPQTEGEQASRLAERLRTWVARLDEVRVSIGVATLGAGMSGPLELLTEADRAMYEAKARGKNQTVPATRGWQPEVAAPEASRS
jgi:two-component system, sensor histidine kinase LadS